MKYRASTPPYTHNLLRLVAELPWKDEAGSQRMEAMERLNSHYIESRYTEDIAELTRVLTDTEAERLLESARELFEWIKARL